MEGVDVTAQAGATLPDPDFWHGRRVLLTGHTGFKGAWLAMWLQRLGAQVSGFALAPETEPSLFALAAPWSGINSTLADIRDPKAIRDAVVAADPEIVLHLAAQALVRRGYAQPRATFETNVQGTANLLDALAGRDTLQAALVVTSDKCYRNDNSGTPFIETDPLGGRDPYSASKAAQEMLVHSWPEGLPLATARAGNVIGGGDWAADRVLPDLFRAAEAGEAVRLRQPRATRPWQHVLDVLAGYLVYAERLATGSDDLPRAINFGPPPADVRDVGWLVKTTLTALRHDGVDAADWVQDGEPGPAEARALTLDPALAGQTLGWHTRLDAAAAAAWTASWHARIMAGADARTTAEAQIERFAAREPISEVA